MSFTQSAIENAFNKAPRLKTKDSPMPTAINYRLYRDKPYDFTYLTCSSKELHVPGRLIVDSKDELSRLMVACDQEIRMPNNERTKLSRLAALNHEEEHVKAAKLLGVKVVKRGIQAIQVPIGTMFQYSYCPLVLTPGWRTTKLNHALLLVYPEKPSDDDLHIALEDLGFGKIEAIAELALKHNLPLPLSINR